MAISWFQQAKWGVFMHFLADMPGTQRKSRVTVEAWNRLVDGFDVEGLARQLEEVGAGYLVLTLGQNSGHYCSPNATYDELVGIVPSKCSRRDLVADMSEALTRRGIRLLTYLPSGAPEFDAVAVEKLNWKKNGGRLAEFQLKWERVIREWSLRWGKRVSGWWIDGCYFADDMYRYGEAPNFASFAAALKAGNPNGIIAFNPGVRTPVQTMTEWEDYSAGELSEALPVFGFGRKPALGCQYHTLTYLGESWAHGAPRFPDELVVGYTRYVNCLGGVVSWDVPHDERGLITSAIMGQLRQLKD